MSWVRIDDNAMDHPKFLALTDGAWRLWCEGQTYCQKHLTDGAISRTALRGFRYYSPSRLKCLLTAHVAGKSALWEEQPDGSIHVHDFHDWNDSRETVLRSRDEAKERRRRWYEKHKDNASGNASTDASTNASNAPLQMPNVRRGVVQGLALKKKESDPSEELASDFLERYPEIYSRVRNGARYSVSRLNMERDYAYAVDLARGWPDAKRLEMMAELFLIANVGDKNQPGTIGQFLHMAPQMDAELRRNGR